MHEKKCALISAHLSWMFIGLWAIITLFIFLWRWHYSITENNIYQYKYLIVLWSLCEACISICSIDTFFVWQWCGHLNRTGVVVCVPVWVCNTIWNVIPLGCLIIQTSYIHIRRKCFIGLKRILLTFITYWFLIGLLVNVCLRLGLGQRFKRAWTWQWTIS